MKSILYLSASPRFERSHSRELAHTFLGNFLELHPEFNRWDIDLTELRLPEISETFLNARYKALHNAGLNQDERAIWEAVKDEFRRFNTADYYLFSLPMWNFTLPYYLKQYIDFITQPGIAFELDESGTAQGALRGRKAAVIYASGSEYNRPDTESLDFVRPVFRQWASFIGLECTFFNFGGNDMPIDHEERRNTLENEIGNYLKKLSL